jgi:hypothetical protein
LQTEAARHAGNRQAGTPPDEIQLSENPRLILFAANDPENRMYGECVCVLITGAG